MRGILVFPHCILYFLIKKLLERVFTRPNEWEAPTPLRRRERDFLVVKSVHVSYHWMRNHALFHMERRVMTYHGWIAVGNRLFEFFLFFSLFYQLNCNIAFFVVVCWVWYHLLDSSRLDVTWPPDPNIYIYIYIYIYITRGFRASLRASRLIPGPTEHPASPVGR